MGQFINFNGKIIQEDQPIYTAASRAARFGDGIFETMRVRNGKILFEDLHKERLVNGLRLMRFQLASHFNWDFLRSAIEDLLKKNQHDLHARVRLMITRGDGGIMDEPLNAPQFLVESWNVSDYQFEETGIKVDVFHDFPKTRSAFANIKTCNFLPSVMAVLYAKENKLDESILINDEGHVCDATVSNIFWVRDGKIFTTPLSDGGVAGVMRSYLIQVLHQNNMPVTESSISFDEIKLADEIFLSNVIRGVQWVKQIGDITLTNHWSRKVFDMMIASTNVYPFGGQSPRTR